ncbi:hypothetical protein GCM10023191_016050 [Actinoallomurus oryzae]|jgi:hypothetical protein|uniref:CU044_5270 family protein n=1 Tax=Actinoallomurus oryzae TaxID=502180 RepID=A0ABP8PL10_9ACTN
MDEMQLIGDLRRDVPAITPDAAEAARTRLTASFEEPARPRSTRPRRRAPRLAWRVAVAGGSAAAIAAGGIVALSTGGEDGGGGGHVRAVTAAEVVLDRAAGAAASAPFTAPRPDQWVYQHIQSIDRLEARDQTSPQRGDSYRWTRASGDQVVDTGLDGVIGKPTHVSAFPPQSYASVAKLPVEPEALLRWVRSHRPATDRTTDFWALSRILQDGVLPPRLKATIFQAMKELPGVTVRKGVTDLRGRAAIAVVGQTSAAMGGVRLNEEVLLDPIAYTYRGEQTVLSADLRMRNKGAGVRVIKAGTVTGASVIVKVAIVDRPGRRS